MAVPSKKDLHRPILEIAAETDGSVHRRKIFDSLIERLDLTTDDLADRSTSGSRRFYDRASFAMHDLQLSGFLLAPERGYRLITDEGRQFLQTHEGVISDGALRQRQAQLQPNRGSDESSVIAISDAGDSNQNASPSELMDVGFWQLQSKLVDDMLESVMGVSSDRFERLVVDLLVKMGYGQGEQVGRSGDGGIDGIINQDPLGLEKVYLQAKRWTSSVGEPEIRNFSGSLDAKGATKGVFITTSTFSGTARQTAQNISAGNKFIRLVDGDELARLMIRHDVGVVTEYTYEVKKLDENYFAEDV
jgi:restriction system protein